MTGAPPAPPSSLILTRVCDGAAAPEASQVMRQFPPRPRPGAWPATGLAREQVSGLLLADPLPAGQLRRRSGSAPRAWNGCWTGWSASQALPGRNAGRRPEQKEPPGGGTWCRAFPAADTGTAWAACCC